MAFMLLEHVGIYTYVFRHEGHHQASDAKEDTLYWL